MNTMLPNLLRIKPLETFMNEIGLEGEPEPFKSLKFISRIFLTHPRKSDEFSHIQIIKYMTWTSIIGFPFLFGLCGHFLMATSGEILSERFESLSYVIQLIILTSYTQTYMYVGNRLMKLLKRIDSAKFGRPDELLQEFSRINTWTVTVYCFTCVMVVISTVNNYYFNVYCAGREILKDKRYVCGLKTPAWFPVEIDSERTRLILLVWYFVFTLLAVPHGAVLGFAAIGFPRFLMIRFRDLRNQIDQINDLDVMVFSRRFNYFNAYYSDILWCIKELNATIGYCFVTQYVCMTLMLATLEYNIVISRNYLELGNFTIWVGMEALFCLNGQSLENEHEALITSVCNLPWYKMPSEVKLNYKLFLGRIQLPVHVKAQPIVDLNNKFLLYILRGTYSMLMFFSHFSKEATTKGI